MPIGDSLLLTDIAASQPHGRAEAVGRDAAQQRRPSALRLGEPLPALRHPYLRVIARSPRPHWSVRGHRLPGPFLAFVYSLRCICSSVVVLYTASSSLSTLYLCPSHGIYLSASLFVSVSPLGGFAAPSSVVIVPSLLIALHPTVHRSSHALSIPSVLIATPTSSVAPANPIKSYCTVHAYSSAYYYSSPSAPSSRSDIHSP
ncbi:hypothetical protein BD413DRAFT_206973 [Trametes elegans]|nr:hypothetical protein BD413DRAFT_206973 [Trametes elegans]